MATAAAADAWRATL